MPILCWQIHFLCEFGQNKFRCLIPRAGQGHIDRRMFYKKDFYSGFRGPHNGYLFPNESLYRIQKESKQKSSLSLVYSRW